MNFMEAVKAMEKGKKVRRKHWDKSTPAIKSSETGMLVWDDEEREDIAFQLNFAEATDWEIVEEEKKTLREELAELEHDQWQSWVNYVMRQYSIPRNLMEKWLNNMKPYSELSEEEKDKDREWADKVMEVFKPKLKGFIERIRYRPNPSNMEQHIQDAKEIFGDDLI